MSKLKAFATYVIILPLLEKPKTAGGIFLPTEKNKVPTIGRVMSRGDQVKSVRVGDKVLFKKWEAIDVTWETQKLKVLDEKNLLAVLE